jgi:glyoxylase-like metal-dependent hydrolase (beta-lactamase superfamily II)
MSSSCANPTLTPEFLAPGGLGQGSSSTLPPGLHPVGSFMVNMYLLVGPGAEDVTLIDSGLFLERWMLLKELRRLDLPLTAIKRVLLTHGHLDHTGNLEWLVRRTGAKVYAHPADKLHVLGRHQYRGWSRGCAALEGFGRLALGWRPVPVDHEFQDGQLLDFWGGLRVIGLPGHTMGHVGFYSIEHDILFCGDLVALYWYSSHFPNRFLNLRPDLIPESLAKAAALRPRLVLPNHHDATDYEQLTMRFWQFCQRHGLKTPGEITVER